MITSGIGYPHKVSYCLSAQDGNGKSVGQLRGAFIQFVNDFDDPNQAPVADLLVIPDYDADGFNVPTGTFALIKNVPYNQKTLELKGNTGIPGTWM